MLLSLRQLHKSIWKDSWSRLWGHAQLWGGAIAASLSILGEVLNDNTVKNATEALHLDPRIMLGLAVLGVVTLTARTHKDA